ncbi:hypothetical protein LGR54_09930 [Ancylobacter sp. Lp-2]|uniref:hypothetical protein n=1 Tax=Ancylobacter sp. Lp-2 TaxID=2881339 RepID=UPI001E3D3A30|nr:hypothetical protein [Ancylobacter sp. Lp-2]MCB4768923.1 hypothetical protein [Ancylobacter sp. Lp-2]
MSHTDWEPEMTEPRSRNGCRSERFLKTIVMPNFAAAVDAPDDERHMANAVLTIDACIGLIHRDLIEDGHHNIPSRDDNYRDQLAETTLDYHLLRDLAAAYKHGELTGKKPRLLRTTDQMSTIQNELGFLQCGDELGGNILIVETSEGKFVRATDTLFTTVGMARDLVKMLTTPEPA